jgi:hypothetical protein
MLYSVLNAKWLAWLNSKEKSKMKRFVIAIALACAISGSALAGDIHTVGAPEPAPVTAAAPDPGDVQAPAANVVTTIILTLISLAT